MHECENRPFSQMNQKAGKLTLVETHRGLNVKIDFFITKDQAIMEMKGNAVLRYKLSTYL